MSARWKNLTAEISDISCPQSRKLYQGNSTVFHVQEVKMFNWRDLRYFMSTKSKILAGELYFHVREVEKINWRDLQYFMFTKWKILAGELYYISCPRSGKF